jgi:chaperonin GroEL
LIDNGFGSSATINNPEKEALELHDVRVIYTNHTISTLEPIKPILESLVRSGQKQIVVMARAFTESAVRECLTNMEAGIGIYPLNAAYTDQAEMMLDLQAILGGRFINLEEASLDAIQLSDVGFAHHVLAKRMSTVFTGAEGREDAINERIATLEKKREGSPSQFEKKNLSARLAQLKNGFALIKIGAISETERKYKKDKADDAVNAVRAALQEGVIPGAGQALKTIADELPDTYILKNAIKAPYEQIAVNAGKELEIPEWVQDSTKVTRVALEKACSVAATLATAAGAITTRKQKFNAYIQQNNPQG